MRVAILVTHLLGTGHLNRAALLADGFAAAGHEALLLSGGMPAPNAVPHRASMQQLEPLRAATAAFADLVDENGNPVDDALFERRRHTIEQALQAFQPDLMITELFPFGRRKLAAEFEATIAAAGDAFVFSSIRDILQRPRKPGRVDEAESRFARLYDGAFVHGDDALAPLSASWLLPEVLADKIFVTGYIGTPASRVDPDGDGQAEIIVAAGGGPVGDRLFSAAIDAQARGTDGRVWRFLVGGHDRESRIAALKTQAPPTDTLIIEPVRPDFRALLARCDLAVLQCGYNTAMDVIATGARALFCPFEEGGETEQRTRTEAMVKRFGCGVILERDLSGKTLAQAAQAMLLSAPPDYGAIRLDGVEMTVTLAERLRR